MYRWTMVLIVRCDSCTNFRRCEASRETECEKIAKEAGWQLGPDGCICPTCQVFPGDDIPRPMALARPGEGGV